jgi:predicted PurR-regulated permease PerM
MPKLMNNNMSSFIDSRHFKAGLLISAPLVLLILLLIDPIKHTAIPFIFAFIAAYVLTPVVRVAQRRIKFPKLLTILFIYIIFVLLMTFIIFKSTTVIRNESGQVRTEAAKLTQMLHNDQTILPDWAQDMTLETVNSVQESFKDKQKQPLPYLKGALGNLLSMTVFFIATFYFLLDEEKFSRLFRSSKLGESLHGTIQNYFRGQVFLIFFMAFVTWLFLTLIHVKFALLLGIFTGIAELVPIMGPIATTFLGVFVVFLTGANYVGGTTIVTALAVIIGFGALRQLEDFFMIPIVMSKSTKLHPMLILFTTLLGNALYGPIGLILAVPFVATYKVVLEYAWNEYVKKK